MTAQPCPNTFFCRGPSGKTHPCVYWTVWPVSKRLVLVYFLTSVNTLGTAHPLEMKKTPYHNKSTDHNTVF
jgi:hypothetical protein